MRCERSGLVSKSDQSVVERREEKLAIVNKQIHIGELRRKKRTFLSFSFSRALLRSAFTLLSLLLFSFSSRSFFSSQSEQAVQFALRLVHVGRKNSPVSHQLLHFFFFFCVLQIERRMRKSLLVLLIVATISDAFYLPGLAPNVFCRKETADSKCKVESQTSRKGRTFDSFSF